MTNREWLESLSDEELARQLLERKCTHCICEGPGGNACCNTTCGVATEKWLRAEHREEKRSEKERLDDSRIDQLLCYLQEVHEESTAEEIRKFLSFDCIFFVELDDQEVPSIRVQSKDKRIDGKTSFDFRDILKRDIVQILRKGLQEDIAEGFAINVTPEEDKRFLIRFRDTQGTPLAGHLRIKFTESRLIIGNILYTPTRRPIYASAYLDADDGELGILWGDRPMPMDKFEEAKDDNEAVFRLMDALIETIDKIKESVHDE